ncbi:protein kinase [Nocardia sp. NPDC059177]|uniref:protein kinase domain-containing protein n=1 Tax=Nocardia sp. NPDC059177 TaxID=3346759 RepID=UPI0036D0D115
MTIQPPGPGVPEAIGRYRVLGSLESAPGFQALLAADPGNSLVVVQQVDPDLLSEPEFRVRLRHTAVAAMRVSGASNTTVIDVDADAESPWVASVFVPGIRLDRAVTEHGPLPVPAVRALAGSLASALRAVHAAGLVHRRLRADSVLLSTDRGYLGDIGITPVDGAPATGTASTAGTPEYLAPEQALGLQVTAAADVFALGSVLAFAASGVTPFAAPSVPYTLFNIAQREPDLSQVPEPLVEMLAACLRKDPAARPTPGQILQYLGAPSTEPPPWPEPVLDDIGRQQHEITALLAALPPVTIEPAPARPVSERLAAAGTATLEFARRALESGRRRWRATSPKVKAGAAAGVVAVLLALTGITYVATREPAPITGLTMAQARQIDACAWLESALGDAVPVEPEALPRDTWKLSENASWGCVASSGGYYFSLDPGQENEFLTPNETVVDGVAIIDGSEAMCARAIAAPGDEHEAGVVIGFTERSTVTECAGLDYIAANIARSLASAPRDTDRDSALAALDPCALLDRDTVTQQIGELPAEPTIADAHLCQWDAQMRLTVKLLRTSALTTGDGLTPVTVDGIPVYQDKGNSKTICTRAYLVPDAGQETIEVTVHGAEGGHEESCGIATTILRAAVDKLPRR